MTSRPRHAPDPWLRSLDESLPPERYPDRHAKAGEILLVLAVGAAILAMAIWFLFLATGGIGPGSM